MKSVRILIFSGPFISAFGLSTERYHCVKHANDEGERRQNFNNQNAAKRDENDISMAA